MAAAKHALHTLQYALSHKACIISNAITVVIKIHGFSIHKTGAWLIPQGVITPTCAVVTAKTGVKIF